MSEFEIGLLFAVGLFGGATNAVVGGATFFTFPILLASGLPPVTANATNALALWPASATAALAYRPELTRVRSGLPLRLAIALAGGVAGAFLLLLTGDALFLKLVPWLLVVATLVFAFSRTIVNGFARMGGRHPALAGGMEFVLAVYGGYFGSGVGIMLMAVLVLNGERDLQMANAQKNLLSAAMNASAIAVFALQDVVAWSVALAVMAGAMAGGYFGARVAKLIPLRGLRFCVIAAGAVASAIYFTRIYR